jgi:hypothetical protein
VATVAAPTVRWLHLVPHRFEGDTATVTFRSSGEIMAGITSAVRAVGINQPFAPERAGLRSKRRRANSGALAARAVREYSEIFYPARRGTPTRRDELARRNDANVFFADRKYHREMAVQGYQNHSVALV